MIKAVFFDLFNTLVHYDPLPEAQQQRACRACGIDAALEDIRRGYWAASDFFSRENGRFSVEKRTEQERQALFIEYEYILLREAGIEPSREQVISILHQMWQTERKVVFFEDTLPTLMQLHRRGLTVGIISNLESSVEEFCGTDGLNQHVDFALTSHEIGFEKPHPQIFNKALEQAGIEASQAVHVGDQYHSDIIGARNAGIRPLLLDRNDLLERYDDCQRINALADVIDHIN